MFKRFIFILLSLLILSTNAYALPIYSRGGNCLTGGTPGCLDSYDGATLNDGDVAFIVTGTSMYVYSLDADSGLAESSPDVIAPDTAPGLKRWILQPITLDSTLNSISNLGTAADKGIYTTGVDTWAEFGLTAFARSILDDANEATFKATVNLEIGTDVQGYDPVLNTLVGLSSADSNFIVGSAAGWVAESGGTARTSLGVAIGSDVLAYDAGIQNLAGVTMAADKFYYTSADNTHVAGSVTTAGRALIDDANAAAQATTLGLGTGDSPTFAGLSVNGEILGQDTAGAGNVLKIGNDSRLVDIDIANTAALYGFQDATVASLKLGSGGGTISGSSGNITIGTNVGIGITALGTSAANVLGIGGSTAPTTSPADMIQLWSADRSAGYAQLHYRAEGGIARALQKEFYIEDYGGGTGVAAATNTTAFAAALTAAAAEAGIVVFGGGGYNLNGKITIPNDSVGIEGQGWRKTILNWTSDLNDDLIYSTGKTGISLKGFSITSDVQQSSGAAIHLYKTSNSILEEIDLSYLATASRNLYHGFWFDEVDTVFMTNFIARVDNDALRVNGGAGAGQPKSGLYLSYGRILFSGCGIRIGGAFGGIYTDFLDIIQNTWGVIIDQTLTAEQNREIFFGANVSIDGNTNDGLILSDPMPNGYIGLSGTWVASNGRHGINVAAVASGTYNLNITGGTIFQNGTLGVGDGIYIGDIDPYINITGTIIRGNGYFSTGWGINNAVTSTKLNVDPSNIFHDNTSGDISTGWKVGVGTLAATHTLTLVSPTAAAWAMKIKNTAANGVSGFGAYDESDVWKGYVGYDNNDNILKLYGSSGVTLAFYTNDTQQMTIDTSGNTVIAGTLTVNGNQTGAADHVFDDYDDIDLLRKWRKGEKLPFEIGDILNRDRLLRDAIIQLEKEVAANKITIQELTKRVLKLESSKN